MQSHHRILAASLFAGLLLVSCDRSESPTQASSELPPPPVDQVTPQGAGGADAVKTRAGNMQFVAHPERFAAGLHLGSLAITPTRMLATTVGDAPDKLVSISELGAVATFSFLFQAPPEAICHLAIAPGTIPAFPEGEVFVSHENQIFRLNPDGTEIDLVASLPPPKGDVAGLCFDRNGTFEQALLVLATEGAVYVLNGVEPFHEIGSVGAGGRSPSVASQQSGNDAGHLLVSFPARGEVRALSPEGVSSFVTGWSGVAGACSVPEQLYTFGRSGGSLFVAVEGGEIYSFHAAQMGPLTGDLLLTSLHTSGSGVATPQGSSYTLRAFSRFWGAEYCAAFVQPPAVTSVDIDIDPGHHPDFILWGSNESVPVALLSSSCFAPNEVDAGSVRLAGAGPAVYGRNGFGDLSDLNGDGDLDLVLYFRPAEMQIQPGHSTLVLEGMTFAGEAFRGSSGVQVQGP